MARKFGIWGGSTLSGVRVSFEEAVANPVEGMITDPQTGEDVSYDAEFASLVMESAEIAQDIEQVAETNEAVDTGETVADIGDSIAQREEGATPEEAALVQAGVAQTLDASDAPSEVVDEVTEGVATESYGRIKVSMEGFKDVLKRMWQATKEFVTRIVNAIKDTWRRFWNSTAGVIKDAEKILKDLEDLKDADGDKKLEKWNSAYVLLTIGGAAFDPAKAVSNIGKLNEIAKAAGKETSESVKNIKTAVSALKDVKDAAEISKKSEELMGKLTAGTSSARVKDIFGKHYVGKAEELEFGNQAIYTAYSNEYSEAGEEVSRINSLKCKIDDAKANFNPKPKDFKVASLKHAQVKSVAEGVKTAMESLDDFYNKDSKKVHDEVDSIKKDVDSLIEKADEGSNSDVKQALRVTQRLYYIPTQLLRGEMDRCIYTIKVAKAFLSLCRAATVNFKKKESK